MNNQDTGSPRTERNFKKTRDMVVLLNLLLFLMMTLVLGIAGFYGYANFFGTSPLEYPSLPFDVITKTVSHGEKVSLIVFRCNSKQTPIIINTTRNLFNIDTGKKFVLAASTVEVEPGCHRVSYVVDTIPNVAPPGNYILYGNAIVDELMHQHTVPWSSDRFKVVDSDEDKL